MLGPVDFIAVGFKGNNFDGSILEALSEATDKGVIRVVDLLFVIKDEYGNLEIAEVQDQHGELKSVAKALGQDDEMPLLTEDDTAKIGELMENNTSAGILVIEQLWAKDLKRALVQANGELLSEGRIHPDKIDASVSELEAVAA